MKENDAEIRTEESPEQTDQPRFADRDFAIVSCVFYFGYWEF